MGRFFKLASVLCVLTTIIMAGCIEPEPQKEPKYNDLPNPHYRPRHDIPIEP